MERKSFLHEAEINGALYILLCFDFQYTTRGVYAGIRREGKCNVKTPADQVQLYLPL